MKNSGSDELRSTFLDFFQERGHPHLPQAPLVPLDDQLRRAVVRHTPRA